MKHLLQKLTETMDIPNTQMAAFQKITCLMELVLRYELIEFGSQIPPRPALDRIIHSAITRFTLSQNLLAFRNKQTLDEEGPEISELHEGLFDLLWPRYVKTHMTDYIDRYKFRIRHNKLNIKGKRILDIGCGNGGFTFAMLDEGAASGVGVDFGFESINHALNFASEYEYNAEFRVASAYDLPFNKNRFDFAIQNGVFHHLEDEDKALEEMARVLKPGGEVWYYVNGEGAIKADLLDASREILKDVPSEFIVHVLSTIGLSENKLNYLSDGFKAVYKFTTMAKLTEQLAGHGFSIIRRLSGGMPTDFDKDKIDADPHGKEKWGEGNLRLLCRKEE